MTIKVSFEPNADPLTPERIEANRKAVDAHLEAAAGGYTKDQLLAAFDAVKSEAHWKNPIDAIVSRDQIDVLGRAIPWFTGTEASFSDTIDPGKVRVVAPGYWAGPCN